MLEKLVSCLFLPVPVICDLLVIGLVLLWFTRRQKAGKIVVTAGAILLLLLGNGQVSGVLLRTLEERYHPIQLSSLPPAMLNPSNGAYIVVLGSGYTSDPQVDLDSHISEDGMVRLVEGIRLCRKLKGCKLLLSGGPPGNVLTMRKIALSLGIPQQDILLEKYSRDTEQEAQFIKPMVGPRPFLLVTSASHMPRAMGLLRKLGMQPIAAPTDYLAKHGMAIVPDGIYPDTYGLHEAERTVYEYLGMAWETLHGQFWDSNVFPGQVMVGTFRLRSSGTGLDRRTTARRVW